MKYNECKNIECKLCQAWYVYIPNGEQILILCDPAMSIEDIHSLVKQQYATFKIQRLDVGQLHTFLRSNDHTYSGDARQIDQDWNVGF